MSKHTPEPWSLVIDHDNKPCGVQMGDVGGFEIHRDANAEHNSRRIVACVNACAGLPTDLLESERYPQTASYALRMEIEAQRDELLHLLGRCETLIRAIDPANGRHILADIAKARGQK